MIIDKPYVIDRETLKTLLQIADTTYDTLIDIYLPIVSEDVELICNQSFVCEYTGTLISGTLTIVDINVNNVSKNWLVSTEQYDNAKITDADYDNNTLTTEGSATATLEDATILINQFPIAKRIVISQMVAFQLVKNNGVITSTKGSVKSKSLPPLSVTYDDKDTSLSGGFGYPSYIVSALKAITKPRFY